MRQWLLGVVAASVLSSIAMLITPAGRVRQVTRMTCGVVCALAMISPLLQIDMDTLFVSMAAYEQAAQSIMERAEEESKMLERTYIEEECAAYILSKATEKQVPADAVTVSARWDDELSVWYPWSVDIEGPYSQGLSALMETELGIPPERQTWMQTEGVSPGE